MIVFIQVLHSVTYTLLYLQSIKDQSIYPIQYHICAQMTSLHSQCIQYCNWVTLAGNLWLSVSQSISNVGQRCCVLCWKDRLFRARVAGVAMTNMIKHVSDLAESFKKPSNIPVSLAHLTRPPQPSGRLRIQDSINNSGNLTPME